MDAISPGRPLIPALLLCLACGPGLAAPTRAPASAGWSPSACGREPAAPVVDTATVQRYNASIDLVTAYDSSARAYNDCVSRAAVAKQTEISNQARARIDAVQAVSAGVQRRIAANFASLGGALKKGASRLQPAGK